MCPCVDVGVKGFVNEVKRKVRLESSIALVPPRGMDAQRSNRLLHYAELASGGDLTM